MSGSGGGVPGPIRVTTIATRAALVEREAELTSIRRRLGALGAQGGSVVIIEGSPGSGKSRLVAEALSAARIQGLRCYSGAGQADTRYVPFSSMLDALLGGEDPVLDRTVLRDLGARPDQQYWMLDELQQRIEQASLKGPLVIALDDVQWADDSTLLALRVLTRRLSSHPILWLLALRRSERSVAVATLLAVLHEQGAVEIGVEPLSPSATEDLVTSVLEVEAIGPVLSQALAAAEGVPLMVVMTVRGFLEDPGILREGRRAELADTGHRPATADLPTVRDYVRGRLARLSPGAREQVELAAALSPRFTVGQVARLGGIPVARAAAHATEALTADVFLDGDRHLTFRHDLVREAIKGLTPAPVYRALRRQAAGILLADNAPLVEVATLLAESAERGDRDAAAALRRAGQELTTTSPAVAASFTEAAMRITDAELPEYHQLVAELVPQLWLAGQVPRAVALGERALARITDPEIEASIRLGLARISGVFETSRGVEQCRRALALSGVSSGLRASLTATLAALLYGVRADLDQCRQVVDRALDMTADGDAPVPRIAAMCIDAALTVVAGDFRAGLDRLAEVESAAEAAGANLWTDLDLGYAAKVFIRFSLGDARQALLDTDVALGLAHEAHLATVIQTWQATKSCVLYARGLLDDAAAETTAVLEALPDLGVDELDSGLAPSGVVPSFVHNIAFYMRALTSLRLGDEQAAARDLAHLERDHEGLARAQGVWLHALLADASGDPAEVRAWLGRADPAMSRDWHNFVDTLDPTEDVRFVRLAMVYGEHELASQRTAMLEDLAGRNPDLTYLTALALHARGLLDADPVRLERAVDILESHSRPLALADAIADAAGRLVHDPARRAARLTSALTLYRDAGALADVERVRLLAGSPHAPTGSGRGTMRPARDTTPEAAGGPLTLLTPSERRVVELVVAGATNREAARELRLSPHTVNTHLRHAFVKLGVRSRVQLVRRLDPTD